jgi:hypothetical protein
MTNEKLTELLKIAYRWGRDNGSNRSEKNFNDLLQTEAINQALSLGVVVGQSEQLVCDHQWKSRFSEKRGSWRLCTKCSKEG